MNVTLLEQHSRATCVHGVSYGSSSPDHFWVRNCRGVFRCGPTGSPIACGYPVGRPRYTCRCDGPVWSFQTGANIGRWESCGVWSNASGEAEREPARPPTRRERRPDLLLVIGVITGPGATERRRWLRHNAWKLGRDDLGGARVGHDEELEEIERYACPHTRERERERGGREHAQDERCRRGGGYRW